MQLIYNQYWNQYSYNNSYHMIVLCWLYLILYSLAKFSKVLLCTLV